MKFDHDTLVARYYELCDERDAVYKITDPIQLELDAANAEMEAARVKALELAAKIDAVWGPDWIAKKKEIAQIARFLFKIPPRPGTAVAEEVTETA